MGIMDILYIIQEYRPIMYVLCPNISTVAAGIFTIARALNLYELLSIHLIECKQSQSSLYVLGDGITLLLPLFCTVSIVC
jgi:hypothetical protein